MADHTQTPWDIQNKGHVYDRSGRVEVVKGINPDGSKLLPRIVRMPDLSNESYANARFIVQAVNAHDELLGLCEQAIRIFAGHSGGADDPKVEIEVQQGYNWLDRARVAIARAKGT